MPELTIDGHQVEVPHGATILDAAKKLGIELPTLCFLESREPSTRSRAFSASCMVCVVKVREPGRPDHLVPSCGTRAVDGMEVESETEEVHEVRRAALELLLSDHIGDCIAPCQMTCPANMNIPLMIRQIAAGDVKDAVATVKEHIPLPAVLGRICTAPCEKGCRRSVHDEPVSVCLLKRFVADADLSAETPYMPPCKPHTGKNVAIVGAGPAGLSAAYYLLREGVIPTLFDEREKPGGMLRYGVPEDKLPRKILDAEIAVIEKMGAVFRIESMVGGDPSLDDLQRDFDAVLITTGERREGTAVLPGVDTSEHGINVEKMTYRTNLPGVFACGSAVRPTKMAVRSVADGRNAAICISMHLTGLPVAVPEKPFTTRIGKLLEGEIERFVEAASGAGRLAPSGGAVSGFTADEARLEALRCLHCDCREPDTCQLRKYAQEYGAKARLHLSTTPEGEEVRKMFEQQTGHPSVVYEPGKCITCGICVKVTEIASEPLGLTFIGRGFNVRIGVPFDSSMEEALAKVAAECVAACPTGALAFK